jgi:hypothetical protein
MAKHGKFVQIAVTSAGDDYEDSIYALDDKGDVWMWFREDWRRLEAIASAPDAEDEGEEETE